MFCDDMIHGKQLWAVAVHVRGGRGPEGTFPAGPEEAGPEQRPRSAAAGDGESRNVLGGEIHGPAVQARDIHGGVHLTVTRQTEPALIPAQLPPDPGIFAGREPELAALDDMTSARDSVRRLALVVISGVGGIGKSSLAVRWAHRVSDSYPDGTLYADLAGHTPDSAVSPETVLGAFLLALGTKPEAIPLELAEQAKLFRSLTTGRRMLLLLDNAASAAQVRAMLPGPGPAGHAERAPAVVLVTTRWRLAGLALDGATFLELEPLAESSSAEILAIMAGGPRTDAEPGAVRDVARLCGGLPLAICVAGAQLAMHPRRPVSRLAAELSSERSRLSKLSLAGDVSVLSAFDLSYQALPEAAARFYRLLSLIFTPDFGTGIAAAQVGVGYDEATGLLEILTGASLLEETADGRFKFHDLVRLHARQKAEFEPLPERADAVARAIDWFLLEAVLADRKLLPGRWRLNPMYASVGESRHADSAAALDWLESEMTGLVAAVHAAHDNGFHDRAWQLCEALSGLFAHRKHVTQWIDTHQTGLASAVAAADHTAESVIRIRLGLAYLTVARRAEAGAEFHQALDAARRAGHRLSEASALEHAGLVRLATGQPEAAVADFRTALAIFREIGSARGAMIMTRRIGEASRDAGRHEEAISSLREARELAAAMGEPYHEMRSMTSLGQAHTRAEDPRAALVVLGEALDIAAGTGARYEQARIHAALADAELALGRRAEARDQLAVAFATYSELGVPEADVVGRLLTQLQ